MKIFLTTDEDPEELDMYRCLIWTERPVKRWPLSRGTGEESGAPLWVQSVNSCRRRSLPAILDRVHIDDLAALGFPPPGKCREYEIPPCEEGE